MLGRAAGMIDADVHNEVPRVQALFPYLADYWVEHITNTMFKGPTDTYYPPGFPLAMRPVHDAASRSSGSPAETQLVATEERVAPAT